MEAIARYQVRGCCDLFIMHTDLFCICKCLRVAGAPTHLHSANAMPHIIARKLKLTLKFWIYMQVENGIITPEQRDAGLATYGTGDPAADADMLRGWCRAFLDGVGRKD